MASTKHKTRTPRERPDRLVSEPPPRLAPALQEPPIALSQTPDAGSRFALAVWLTGFLFLFGFLLWDLVTALLFR